MTVTNTELTADQLYDQCLAIASLARNTQQLPPDAVIKLIVPVGPIGLLFQLIELQLQFAGITLSWDAWKE